MGDRTPVLRHGQHVRYLGHDKEVVRVDDHEPAVLCRSGYPALPTANERWYYTVDIEPVADDAQ